MDLETIISRLREHEAELRKRGVLRLSVFGSMARREAGRHSDIDMAAVLDPELRLGLTGLGRLEDRLREILEAEVDLVSEPVIRKPRLQQEIEQDRVIAF